MKRLPLIIALIALIAPTLRYAVAFQAAEPSLHVFGLNGDISAFTGLAIAVSYEGAAALGLHEALKAREKAARLKNGRWNRYGRIWWWPALSAAVQVVVGAGIIVPVLVAELRSAALVSLLGAVGAWAWSIAAVAATPLTLATVVASLAVQPQERKASLRPRKPVASTQSEHQHAAGGISWDKSLGTYAQVREILSQAPGLTNATVAKMVGCAQSSVHRARKASRNDAKEA